MKTSRQIIAETAAKHGLSVEQIMGRCRQRRIAWPRQEAMFQIFVECRHLSLPSIGRALGGLDHTTVLHGVQSHAKRMGLEYSELKRIVGRGGPGSSPPSLGDILAFRRAEMATPEYFETVALEYGLTMHWAMENA